MKGIFFEKGDKKELEHNEKMGRPRKLTEKRTAFSIYIDNSVMDKVDEFIFNKKKETRAYSRSDFFTAAADAYIKANAEK